MNPEMFPWRYVPARGGVMGQVIGRVPTEFGPARLVIAYRVHPAFGRLVEQAPAMEALLRKTFRSHNSSGHPCGCVFCTAAEEILRQIEGGA